MRIVHVLPRLGMTGPGRSLATMIEYGTRAGLDWSHDVVTLEPSAAPAAVVMLRRVGARLHLDLAPDARRELLAAGDVALVHYWQCPSMIDFLAEPVAAPRVVCWVLTLALHAPQTIAPAVVAGADALWCTSRRTEAAPALAELGPQPLVRGLIDPAALIPEAPPPPSDGVVAGYLGTVNRQKLHPDYVALCAAVRSPAARFRVYGGGGEEDALRAAAVAAGLGDRLEVMGFAIRPGDAFAAMDLFAYPLRADTYASTDLAVQEAMWTGLAPVVLGHGGVPDLVGAPDAGVVAADAAGYVAAVEELIDDPAGRTRRGAAARAHAHAEYDPARTVARVAELFDAVRDEPARRADPSWSGSPAARFATALAEHGAPFVRSLAAGPGADAEADAAIAAAPELALVGEGGLFHWRNASPDDPALREWSALVLDARGDHAAAARERAAAAQLRSVAPR